MFDRSCSCCLSGFSFIRFCFVSMLAMTTLPVDLLNFPAMETLDAIFIEVGKFVTFFFCSKIAVIRKLHGNMKALQKELC
ncbi:hypothetical protein AB3S75_017513 [Citrus x aurantiifolia]